MVSKGVWVGAGCGDEKSQVVGDQTLWLKESDAIVPWRTGQRIDVYARLMVGRLPHFTTNWHEDAGPVRRFGKRLMRRLEGARAGAKWGEVCSPGRGGLVSSATVSRDWSWLTVCGSGTKWGRYLRGPAQGRAEIIRSVRRSK